MQQHKAHSAASSRNPSRPGALTLIMHIVKGAFANGMQMPALVCIGLTMALYHEQFPYHEFIAVLLIGSLVLIGLLRGCINWQEDLSEYQGHLAMLRHQEQLGEANRGQTTGHFVPYTHR